MEYLILSLFLVDDPILKQQLLDEINNPSFIPKTFKSGRTDDPNFSNAAITNDHITVENPVLLRDTQKPGYRKNETVFHDSVGIFMINIFSTRGEM